MILAELRGFVSRPIAPTRRIALGHIDLPMGDRCAGGALLGGIAAEFGRTLDADSLAKLDDLVEDIAAARRITQPALRHRLQHDRIGLTPMIFRLVDGPKGLRLTYRRDRCTGMQAILLALYAAQSMGASDRMVALAMMEQGRIVRTGASPAFLTSLLGESATRRARFVAGRMTTEYARQLLGIGPSEACGREQVQTAYRLRLYEVHPDLGGSKADAPAKIAELAEARRLLLAVQVSA